MQYMLLIYGEPGAFDALTPKEQEVVLDEYWALDLELQRSGEFVGSNALHGADTTTSVRVKEGEPVVSDGPFVETKEVLGGYYLVDCADLDRALEVAAKIPSNARGIAVVEVRPVIDFEPPEWVKAARS
jgi:hypothetical protein